MKSEVPIAITIEGGAVKPKMAVRNPINGSKRTTTTIAGARDFNVREAEGRASLSDWAGLITED